MCAVSPGSPSKSMRDPVAVPAATWRSTQLYATLSVPPTNHCAKGAFDQSSTCSQGVAQSSRRAWESQNASRSASAAA